MQLLDNRRNGVFCIPVLLPVPLQLRGRKRKKFIPNLKQALNEIGEASVGFLNPSSIWKQGR